MRLGAVVRGRRALRGLTFGTGPRRTRADASARRALARDHPVTAITSSSIADLSFFRADAYACAYARVISLRATIDNLESMNEPDHAHTLQTRISRALHT